MSLVEAARQLKAHGRGEDTELVHMTPYEVEWLANMQGGIVINPKTGLPEFGLLGKILKGAARVAGAVGGFMVGGPLGAAAGAGLATKATGGSWNQALGAAALSGLGAWGGNALGGAGTGLTTGASVGPLAASTPAMTAGTGAGLGGLQTNMASIPPATQGLGSHFMSAATSPGGLGAAVPALGAPTSRAPGLPDEPTVEGNPEFNYQKPNPFNRQLRQFTGNYATYGQSPQWKFFDQVNPAPTYLNGGGPVRGYAPGGPVTMTPGMPQIPGTSVPPMPMMPMNPRVGIGGIGTMMMPSANGIDSYANLTRDGVMRMEHGGDVHGPGTGVSDDIPAMLSDGEHVIDAATVSLAGSGSNDAGHRVIEDIKAEIRRRAGQKKSRKPPKSVKGLGSFVATRMRAA